MHRRPPAALRRTLVSTPRLRLLESLQGRSPQTASQLAEQVGLHHNTVREHLDRLIDDGLVVRASEHRTVRGRPQVLYSPAHGLDGSSESARAQTLRAIALGRAYRRSYPSDAAEADCGVDAQLDVLEDYLDRSGFEPKVDRGAHEVRLTCPFGSVRGELGHALCGVDREIMCGVLARVEGALEIVDITPTDGPGDCVLRMRRG